MEILVLALVLAVALGIFLARAPRKGSTPRQPSARSVDEEIQERDALVRALTAQMRAWETEPHESRTSSPAETGLAESIARGSAWVTERRPDDRALAEMIAKAAYAPILAGEIERAIGPAEFLTWRAREEKEERELELINGVRDGLDKWWDDADYHFELLLEKACDCGILERGPAAPAASEDAFET